MAVAHARLCAYFNSSQSGDSTKVIGEFHPCQLDAFNIKINCHACVNPVMQTNALFRSAADDTQMRLFAEPQ